MRKTPFILIVLVSFFSCGKDRIRNRDISFDPIKVTQDSCFAVLPNAFTPNNDGLNDAIRPILYGVKSTDFEFVIRNDSKKILFETSQLNEAWDGDDCPSGFYIGTLKGEFECGETFEESIFICLFTDCVTLPKVTTLEFESMYSPLTGTPVFPSGENICP